MRFLCDTNVAYHGGIGNISKASIIQNKEDTLAVSPISSLELITKEWKESKRKACRWLIDNVDEWLDNNECYLSKSIKIYKDTEIDNISVALQKLIEIYANSKDETNFRSQAESYLGDAQLSSFHTGRITFFDDLKNIRNEYLIFFNNMEYQLKTLFPNYSRAKAPKKIVIQNALEKVKEVDRKYILKMLVFAAFAGNYTDGVYKNIVVLENGIYSLNSKKANACDYVAVALAYLDTIKLFDVFIDVTYDYWEDLISQKTHLDITGNDLGDISLLYYVNKECTLVTYENQWADRMIDLGYSYLVKKIPSPPHS